MKMISKRATGALALAAVSALVLSSCSSSGSGDEGGSAEGGSTDTLKIATLLPLTGGLNFLLPPVQAGIDLALSQIEEAGGVLGNPVEVVAELDEGDDKDRTVIEASRDEALASGAAFVLGAMGTGSTLHVYEDIVGAGILMGSPSNTGVELTGLDPFYFRVAPSDAMQASTLAPLILNDGREKVAFLTFNNPYGIGLRDAIEDLVTAGGAEVVYGSKSEGNEFAADQTTFSAEVSAAKASGADAIVIVTYDQVQQIVPEMLAQGINMDNVYLIDGSLVNFTDLETGAVAGINGTKPGYDAPEDFQQMLADANGGTPLDDLTYAAEAYDLVNITALAAEKAGDASADAIRQQLQAVSGANGGTECTTFAECRDLIADGEEIHYVARSGIGPLNENNDPSTAWIGVYEYTTEDNAPHFLRSEEGSI